ncbi:MAG: hypothetical protein CMQ33_13290 [Gammaproteobacteria bacterium]|jgi:mannose-6-phosphate isomerase-like protein (cupin superfamily)|nr:hypothetical protein [Gammaproteobacteria bacterium]|tara:strand:- start:209 stop:586 length:378 start_codon:yes stop_codon:yes gene_type:complete
MSKISITNVEEAPWLSKNVKDGLTTGAQIVGDADSSDLCAFIMHLAPGYETELHSHSEDEVMYVLEGEIRMGRRVLGPESILVIHKDSQYKFTVGNEGVRFLNIRPGVTEYRPVERKQKGEKPKQ